MRGCASRQQCGGRGRSGRTCRGSGCGFDVAVRDVQQRGGAPAARRCARRRARRAWRPRGGSRPHRCLRSARAHRRPGARLRRRRSGRTARARCKTVVPRGCPVRATRRRNARAAAARRCDPAAARIARDARLHRRRPQSSVLRRVAACPSCARSSRATMRSAARTRAGTAAMEHVERVRHVQREVLARAAVGRTKAPRVREAGNRDTLLHVLAVVPCVEIGFVRGVDIRPDAKLAVRMGKAVIAGFLVTGCQEPQFPKGRARPTKQIRGEQVFL